MWRNKYLWLSLNTSWALVFCIDTHVSTISKVIDIHTHTHMYACLQNGIAGNMSFKQRIHV